MPWEAATLVKALRSGRAQYRLLSIPSPAAGVGFSFTVDSLGWLEILALRFQIVTDANAANRFPRIEYRDGDGNDWVRFPSATVTAATLTATHGWIVDYGINNTQSNVALAAPISDFLLMPGWIVACVVGSIQVGDQISNIRVLALDWATLTDDQLVDAEKEENS